MTNYQYYIVLIVLTISDINPGIGLDKKCFFCYNEVSRWGLIKFISIAKDVERPKQGPVGDLGFPLLAYFVSRTLFYFQRLNTSKLASPLGTRMKTYNFEEISADVNPI